MFSDFPKKMISQDSASRQTNLLGEIVYEDQKQKEPYRYTFNYDNFSNDFGVLRMKSEQDHTILEYSMLEDGITQLREMDIRGRLEDASLASHFEKNKKMPLDFLELASELKKYLEWETMLEIQETATRYGRRIQGGDKEVDRLAYILERGRENSFRELDLNVSTRREGLKFISRLLQSSNINHIQIGLSLARAQMVGSLQYELMKLAENKDLPETLRVDAFRMLSPEYQSRVESLSLKRRHNLKIIDWRRLKNDGTEIR
jgi:hypothetical protein